MTTKRNGNNTCKVVKFCMFIHMCVCIIHICRYAVSVCACGKFVQLSGLCLVTASLSSEELNMECGYAHELIIDVNIIHVHVNITYVTYSKMHLFIYIYGPFLFSYNMLSS